MRLNDDDITTAHGSDPEGPADPPDHDGGGGGMPVDPPDHSGGGGSSASGDGLSEGTEGPMDAGASEPADPHVTDGGADGGA